MWFERVHLNFSIAPLKPDKLSPQMSKWGEGGGSQKPLESGQAVYIFLAASPLVLARFVHEFRGFAARVPGLTKPPCYAGYGLPFRWTTFSCRTGLKFG